MMYRDSDVYRGDSDIHLLTLCLCHSKCGSLQIWVSCSFMHQGYSEPFDSDLFILTADSRAAFAGERVDGVKGSI